MSKDRMSEIQEFVAALVARFRPLKVILFGSYAAGQPHRDSDVDLLVVRDHSDDPLRDAVDMRLALKPSFPLDLIVREKADFDRRIEMGDSFLRGVLESGRLMHEA